MSRICDITGKRTRFGNHVSHAHNKTRRKFLPNVHKKRFFVPSEGRWISLTVSTSALRSIHKLGIEEAIKKYNPSLLDKQR